jgi:hypothetical protein
MKQIIFNTLLFFFVLVSLHAQKKISYPLREDVATIDGIMKATYEAVSGAAGEKRQWERDLSLHDPKAVYSFRDSSNGKFTQEMMSLKEFHSETDTMVATTAFYEKEINREVRIYGNIAHVWSTYETRLIKDGPVAARGINSVQLYFMDDRWWIFSWSFDREKLAGKIPASFDKN